MGHERLLMKTKYTAESSQTVSTTGIYLAKSTRSRKGEKSTSRITVIARTFFANFLNKVRN
jgi:hypothetical protein